MYESTPLITHPPSSVFTDNTPTLDRCALHPESYLPNEGDVTTLTPATPLYRRYINRAIAIFAVIGTVHCALIAAPVIGLGGGLAAVIVLASGMPFIAPVCGPAAELLGIIVVVVFSAGGLAGVGFTFFYTPYCMAWVYDSAMNKLESDYQSSDFIQKILQAYGDSGPDQPTAQEAPFSNAMDETKSPECVTESSQALTITSDEVPNGNKNTKIHSEI